MILFKKKNKNEEEIYLTLPSLAYVTRLPTVDGRFHVKKERGIFFLEQRVQGAFGFTVIKKLDRVYQIPEINDSLIRRLLILSLENLDNKKALIYVYYKMRNKKEYKNLLMKIQKRKFKQNFAERLLQSCGQNAVTCVVDESLHGSQEFREENFIVKDGDREVIKQDLLVFGTVNIRINEGYLIIYGAKRILESI